MRYKNASMKNFVMVLALISLFSTAIAQAATGTIDNVPAATLLLPYF